MELWAMWLVVVILLTILEFATINLVSIWFIASGILALASSFITDSIAIQFSIFVVFGIIFLILTKKFIKDNNKEESKTNLDRIIGMEGIVTETIKPNKVGEVKVDGKTWSAISDVEIQEESIIKVNKINGVKLEVEEVKKYELENKESE